MIDFLDGEKNAEAKKGKKPSYLLNQLILFSSKKGKSSCSSFWG